MGERGTYRSISRVIIDGPDFRKLSACARHVFLTLKIAFGPCGVEVYYLPSLASDLAQWTGYDTPTLAPAIQELMDNDWLRVEDNVVWIVDQLRFDPGFNAANVNHQKSVRLHVLGLPRLGIVRAFINRYRDYFPDADSLSNAYPETMASDTHSIAYRMGIEAQKPAPKRHRIPIPMPFGSGKTEDRRPRTEDRGGTTPANGADAPREAGGGWPARVAEFWREKIGEVTEGHIGKRLARIVGAHGMDVVLAAIKAYAEEPMGNRAKSPTDFAAHFVRWRREGEMPLTIDGIPTERGERITRPPR